MMGRPPKMRSRDEGGRPPFSYRVNVGHISTNPVSVVMEADENECAALAAAWGVTAVAAFSAELALGRWKRDGVRVSGSVAAAVEQPCGVTLEPIEQRIEEPVEAIFVPEGSKLARMMQDDAGEVFVDAAEPDAPESFSGDSIDVGALAAEIAALAIDPFPRKPGAAFDPHIEDDSDAEDTPSPFAAALKEWKPKRH